MPQITYIDPDHATFEHPEVCASIAQYHREWAPEATNITVYVDRKENPNETLEWSMIVTGPKGRQHLCVEQRKAGAPVYFNFG